MTDSPVKVLMVHKLPPPQGGMAAVAKMLVRKSNQDPKVDMEVVDIAVRWRTVDQLEIWRRVSGGLIQMMRDCYRFWRSIRHRRPDVIYLNTASGLAMIRDIAMLRIARCFGLRTALHLHFGRVPDLLRNNGLQGLICLHALALANTIIVLDERTFQTVTKAFPRKTVFKIPNCLDRDALMCESEAKDPADRKPDLLRVTYIGWVIPSKGVLELVRAAAKVTNNIPFELEIIGPENPEYGASIRQEGASLGQNLIFRGEQPHSRTMQLLRQTDIFCLPSYTEGFPISVMEAMALGKPIIGTDVGAIAEMVRDDGGDCGIVVPPRDVPALSQALLALLSASSRRSEMGCRGLQIFDSRYTLDIVFERLRTVWQYS